MRTNLPVSNVEQLIPEDEVLISKTDLRGQITYCNQPFCRISGYDLYELRGAPHNLIRHPDVPAELFACMWQQIKSGKPWRGILKNRCKNGDHYWVEANVSPILQDGEITGYLSLRYKVSPEQIAIAERAYQTKQFELMYSDKSDQNYIIELQLRLAQKIASMESLHEQSTSDLAVAGNIISRISNAFGSSDPLVRTRIVPAEQCSGDLILMCRTPVDILHIMLADAVGHGLVAAINLLPLSQIFFSMSKKALSIRDIAVELNSKIHQLMPPECFISAVMVSIDFRKRCIEVWNGGIPAPLLFSLDGRMLHKWSARNLPLGILDNASFSPATEVLYYDEDCQLFMFSDGLSEAVSPQGEQLGNGRIEEMLAGTQPDSRFEGIFGMLENHLSGTPAHDDISVAVTTLYAAEINEQPASRSGSYQGYESNRDWRIEIALGAEELKYLDVIALLSQMLNEIHFADEHRSSLFVILSELLNNALDHGILDLDSTVKQGPDGFETYMNLRDEKLRFLKQGYIGVGLEKMIIDGKNGIKIRVVDSGKGFNLSSIRPDTLNRNTQQQFGRGIALVQKLAYKVEYSPQGNSVVAYYVFA
ncbi:MAG: SpoIIE family protein phosphatase [Nitrosomonadales bacterium]|nr:SpoIIE family protein phosphatase [Nitrosomonadales bacterium]